MVAEIYSSRPLKSSSYVQNKKIDTILDHTRKVSYLHNNVEHAVQQKVGHKDGQQVCSKVL